MPVSDRKAPYCKKKNKLKAKGAGIYRLADGKADDVIKKGTPCLLGIQVGQDGRGKIGVAL